MDIKVDIDANEVTKQLTQIIIEGGIGKAIKDGIERQLKELTTSNYNNPIHDTIKEVIAAVVKEEMLKHQDRIKEIVVNNITDKHVNDIVTKLNQFLAKQY